MAAGSEGAPFFYQEFSDEDPHRYWRVVYQHDNMTQTRHDEPIRGHLNPSLIKECSCAESVWHVVGP
jgi:hypothetical protein